jgi:TatD DNase family protein
LLIDSHAQVLIDSHALGLVDSHAHIQFDDYDEDRAAVVERAAAAGVTKIITVGCDARSSAAAVEMAAAYDRVWAAVGLHPHDAAAGRPALDEIARLARAPKVVGIGECGLDYFRLEAYAGRTTIVAQEAALRFQIELGLELNLPMVFHIRDAFEDFWRIFDDYKNERGPAGNAVRGEVHCFTAGVPEMLAAVDRGLYVALNGVMTFTKDESQLAAARQLPLDRLLLETDCPYLSPKPHRGRRNEPAHVADTAAFLAALRGESLEELAGATTANAQLLFGI